MNKSFIIELLVHEMRYHQLIYGITRLGFSNDLNGSDLIVVVAGLMGIKKNDISDEWGEAYMQFIDRATHYPITSDAQNLLPLAELCYNHLITTHPRIDVSTAL